MSSTGVNYAYIIKLNWVQGEKSDNYVLGICSSLKNLKHALLEIILDLQTKYNHVEKNLLERTFRLIIKQSTINLSKRFPLN